MEAGRAIFIINRERLGAKAFGEPTFILQDISKNNNHDNRNYALNRGNKYFHNTPFLTLCAVSAKLILL